MGKLLGRLSWVRWIQILKHWLVALVCRSSAASFTIAVWILVLFAKNSNFLAIQACFFALGVDARKVAQNHKVSCTIAKNKNFLAELVQAVLTQNVPLRTPLHHPRIDW